MAWLQVNPEGGLAGWGAPPQLHGGDVSSLANAIALLRQHQTENVTKSISDAIREEAARRAGNAFIQQAQNADLVPAGDYGQGLVGAQGAENIAKLIQTDRLRDLQEKLYGAHAAEYNALAAKYNAYAGGGGLTPYQQLMENRRNAAASAYDQATKDTTDAYATLRDIAGRHPNWMKTGPVAPGGSGFFGTGKTPDAEWNQYLKDKKNWEDAKNKIIQGKLRMSHPNLVNPGDINDEEDLPVGGSSGGGAGVPQQPPAQQAPPPQQPQPSTQSPSAPQQPQPSATPSRIAPGYGRTAGPNVGGYVAGKRYGGMMYLGGDPNDRNNWQP